VSSQYPIPLQNAARASTQRDPLRTRTESQKAAALKRRRWFVVGAGVAALVLGGLLAFLVH